MCPVKKGSIYCGLYRAISAPDPLSKQKQISIIGICKSKDGIHFDDRRPFITPDEEWDIYGCEDPRVTYFEGKYYIFYTALSKYPFKADGIRVGLAISKDLKKINEKHLVTPFNAKAMTIFPRRINGKIIAIFSAYTDMPPSRMCFTELDKIDDLWNESFWEEWIKNIDKYTLDFHRNKYDHLEVGAPPLETKDGWLLIYSHIQNYFENPEKLDRIFGIEALLFDLNDPTKLIGRTAGPIIAPSKKYELSGYVSDVVFPSGALINKNQLTIYYGAADTTTCLAYINLIDLIETIDYRKQKLSFQRNPKNPIIAPKPENKWEAQATFNPGAVIIGGKTYILYRAFSDDNTSSLGCAISKNGLDIDKRFSEPIYYPREDFEMKKNAGGYSGCEDPRLTKIGNNIYLCYTAYDGVNPPRVALSSILASDITAHKWNWSKPFLITPSGLDDKDTCIFPAKFKGKYFIIHRINNEICGDYMDSLSFDAEKVDKCIRVMGPRDHYWDSSKVGITAPPIKTKYGWLLLYHGVSKSHNTYRVGAVLLDLKDPAIVISRISDPIFQPEEDYEKIGIISNVVFPCGMTVLNGVLHIYYGGADKVSCVATIKLSSVLKVLINGKKFNDM